MVYPVYEDHTGLRPAAGRPVAKDRREVADIEGDEDAPLPRGEREDFAVTQPLEPRLLIEGADVVAAFLQRSTDPRPRNVGVDKQPHA